MKLSTDVPDCASRIRSHPNSQVFQPVNRLLSILDYHADMEELNTMFPGYATAGISNHLDAANFIQCKITTDMAGVRKISEYLSKHPIVHIADSSYTYVSGYKPLLYTGPPGERPIVTVDADYQRIIHVNKYDSFYLVYPDGHFGSLPERIYISNADDDHKQIITSKSIREFLDEHNYDIDPILLDLIDGADARNVPITDCMI